jgi:hypothetical protein
MWIFTDTGFVSAVCHFDDPGQLVVRARDRRSLEALAESADVEIRAEGTDYPFRVFVAKDQFAAWLMHVVETLDYPNFKGQAMYTLPDYFQPVLHDVHHRLWKMGKEVAR